MAEDAIAHGNCYRQDPGHLLGACSPSSVLPDPSEHHSVLASFAYEASSGLAHAELLASPLADHAASQDDPVVDGKIALAACHCDCDYLEVKLHRLLLLVRVGGQSRGKPMHRCGALDGNSVNEVRGAPETNATARVARVSMVAYDEDRFGVVCIVARIDLDTMRIKGYF